MAQHNKSLEEKLFDEVLKEALKDNVEEEILFYNQKAKEQDLIVSDTLNKKLDNKVKQVKNQYKHQKYKKVASSIAVVLMVIIITHLTFYTFVEAYRVPFQRFVLLLTNEEGVINMNQGQEEGGILKISSFDDSPFKIWIPEEFAMTIAGDNNNEIACFYLWENGDNKITFSANLHDQSEQGLKTQTEHIIDTEDSVVKEILVNKNAGYTIEKEVDNTHDSLSVVWSDENYIYQVYAHFVKDAYDIDVVIDIANSVQIK